MEKFIISLCLLLAAVFVWSVFYLLKSLKQTRPLTALIGLFCMAMGLFLLVLDLSLITFTQGPQYIPDYLLFNRLVSDTGFAGRWMLTIYVFIGTGLILSIYLLARNLITKFNK
jgi:hypothetical protein